MLSTSNIYLLKALKFFTCIFFAVPILLHAQTQNRPAPDGFIIDYVQGLDFVTISWNHLSSVQNCENFRVYYSIDRVESSYPLRKSLTENCQDGSMAINSLNAGVYYFWVAQEWIEEVCDYSDECEDGEFTSPFTQPRSILISPNELLSESFESGLGTFTNAGPFNWLRRSGRTPSSNTGPNSATDSSFYAYMETSNGYAYSNGNQAILESELLDGNESYYISFKYNMYGANMGSLYLETLKNNTWTTIWQKAGQQTGLYNWREAGLNLSNVDKVRFRGKAIGGYLGDMAIDKVQIMVTTINRRVTFLHTDLLGSPIAESDQNGNVQ